jgi:hypothetical protein
MSWQVYTHDMNFVFIRYNGSWNVYNAQTTAHQNEWDIWQIVPNDTWRAGGCEIPSSWSFWSVWTNCHTQSTTVT